MTQTVRNSVLYIPTGSHSQEDDLSTVLTVSIVEGSSLLVQAREQNIRYTIDGTTPTASLGFTLFSDTDPVLIPLPSGSQVKFIEEVSGAELDYLIIDTGVA